MTRSGLRLGISNPSTWFGVAHHRLLRKGVEQGMLNAEGSGTEDRRQREEVKWLDIAFSGGYSGRVI